MNKLLNEIKSIPKEYFGLNDLKKISSLNEASLKVALNRLVKTKRVTKIGNKLYTRNITKIDWTRLACEIYTPSYISFESALANYNILSQQPVHITLATLKRSKTVVTPNINLIYHHLQKKTFWGYTRVGNIFIAEAEKAFLDQAYLSLNGYAKFDPEEMNIKLVNKIKLKQYIKKFKNNKLENLIRKYLP